MQQRFSNARGRPSQAKPVTLLVGAGRMGGALLKGWVTQGIGPVGVVEPTPRDWLREFARCNHVRLFRDIDEAGDLSVSVCVVALKPQILKNEAAQLQPLAASGALMLSIAAGTSIAALRGVWGAKAAIVRAMPNTPGAIGRGISALYAPRKTPEALRRRSEILLAGLGETLWVARENQIDAVTAVSGSGPAYVFLFAECLERAARCEGLPPAIAARLARATIAGAGALLDRDERAPDLLRRDVTSPGGTTEAALNVLMKNEALARLLGKAVLAARARATALREAAEN